MVSSKRFFQSFRSPIVLFVVALVLAGGGGGAGFWIGTHKTSVAEAEHQADLTTFWKAWTILNQNAFTTPVVKNQVDGAISGMVASLNDPYTVYLPPAVNAQFESTLQGSFGGIGAEMIVKDSQLTVESVLSGTPSEKSGLKAQDVILTIDGKKAGEMTFTDAINAIRGDKGTTVHLTIARAGESKPLSFAIVRDTIVVNSVTSSTLGANNSIAYIKVAEFGQDTTAAFQTALQAAVTNNSKGLIVDLRDNPGGYVEAAKAMIGMVLPSTVTSDQTVLKNRVAVLVRSKDGSEDKQVAGATVIAPTLPIVVLVNGGSASASEIFSGAMKDYKRATVVGTQTFGKGSVQDLIDLGNGGSIKVTIAKWFTPLGVGIDGKGITPDITVTLPTDVTPSTSDVQIQKALTILNP